MSWTEVWAIPGVFKKVGPFLIADEKFDLPIMDD